MDNSSLVVVGSGIKFMSHLTTEAKAYITQSDKVLYLVNEPAMKEWIQKNNKNAESLDPIYTKYPLRIDCYRAITDYILDTLRQQQHVCVVLYGHPAVFAQPALNAVRKAREEGYYAKILPGISAEACLFADLLVDPGSIGCHSFEATDLLIHRRQINPHSHLILWQVGIIGALDHPYAHDNTNGAKVLLSYLNVFYSNEHKVTLYEAAQYPHFEPKIIEFCLKELPDITMTPISTLYIPPTGNATVDHAMLEALGINVRDLR
jgi:uncharacterized protein YabN with tetrapyrrole methylase and pyrophosphatase domain